MYVVIEMQTNKDGTVGTLVNSYEDWQQAEAKYHTILAAAAVSALPNHAAMIVTDEGVTVRAEHYEHGGEA